MSSIEQIFGAPDAAPLPSPKPAPMQKRPVGRPRKKDAALIKRRELAANARAAKAAKKSRAKKKASPNKPLQAKAKRPVGRPRKKRPVGRPKKAQSAKSVAEVRVVQGYITPAAKVEALAGVARAVGILMQFGIKECLRQRLPASVILVAVGETAGLVASMMGVPYNQAVKAALSGIQGAYRGKPAGGLADQARLLPGGSAKN